MERDTYESKDIIKVEMIKREPELVLTNEDLALPTSTNNSASTLHSVNTNNPDVKMNEELIQYDVFEDIGEYLDSIPVSLRQKSAEEYKKFLHLKHLVKDTQIPAILLPCEIIDKVWHIHMRRSTLYQKFCQTTFGQNIDYDMAGSRSSANEKAKRLERTKILYKLTFSMKPDQNIWGEGNIFQDTLGDYSRGRKRKGTSMEIKVDFNSKVFSFHCEANDTIESLKQKVTYKEGIPIKYQRMISKTKILEDGKTLLDYNITNGDSVHTFPVKGIEELR